MAQEVRHIIHGEPVLLSPVTHLGEFVARHFYHSIAGFGTVQTEYSTHAHRAGMEGGEPEVKVTWHDFGRYQGFVAHWSIGDGQPDELIRLNDELRDDQVAEAEIKEMIHGQLDDSLEFGESVGITLDGKEASLNELMNLFGQDLL